LTRILKAGALYFVLVFGAGFALGIIRTLWIAPRIGLRIAELIEMPIMLGITFLAARWVVRRLSVPSKAASRLAMGLIALGLLCAAEITVVLRLQGLTLREYVTSRDPVSGIVYLASLALLALMPLFVGRE
jgi:hypothetical protein